MVVDDGGVTIVCDGLEMTGRDDSVPRGVIVGKASDRVRGGSWVEEEGSVVGTPRRAGPWAYAETERNESNRNAAMRFRITTREDSRRFGMSMSSDKVRADGGGPVSSAVPGTPAAWSGRGA